VTGVSIYYLRTRPKPSTYPRDHRVTTTELHTYQVTAYLTQYKKEDDGDIHLVLKDSAGLSMIAEIPYGACVPTISRWKTFIASARAAFIQHYTLSTSWHYVHRLVDVRGLGFMDVLHGQTGVAPNGVELHPVIYIRFH
jgi:predicted cupin superfamily sugar epimerase